MSVNGEPRFRALHALRIKGAATADDVRRLSGLEDSIAALAELEADGLVTSRAAGAATYFALSPAGQAAHGEAVVRRLDDDERGRLAEAYDDQFLDVNVRFKLLCSQWQQEERFELVEEAVDVHEQITGFLRSAAVADARFDRYIERLGATMEAFQEGDGAALVAPVGESYHNVWFELHEDLLVTLGRSRADETA